MDHLGPQRLDHGPLAKQCKQQSAVIEDGNGTDMVKQMVAT